MPDEPGVPKDDEQPSEMPLPESLEHLRPGGGKSSFRGAGKYAGLGIQFVVAILLFLKIGEWLDKRFGTDPVFLYLGVFTGAGAAFYSMYRGLMADQRKADAERQAKSSKGSLKGGSSGKPGAKP